MKTKCTIGICVYNEEKNIRKLIESLYNQQLKSVIIDEIITVVSGSTDETFDIVSSLSKRYKKIKIIKQKQREGKASAVNLLIEKSRNEILVLVGGDLILDATVIQKLVGRFNDFDMGMTGARPIPINDMNDGLSGFAAHLLWDLHHRISMKTPKMGEVVAFRKIFKRIPILSSVDEANIEPLIRGQGYKIQYIPSAKIYNKAPTTISDFIKQRKRIYNGHLAVKHEQSYEVSTMNIQTIAQALFSFLMDHPHPKYFIYTPLVIFLEAYSRYLGWWDYKIVKKRYTVWELIGTTKNLSKNVQ